MYRRRPLRLIAGIGTTVVITALSTGVVRAEGEDPAPVDTTPPPTTTITVADSVVIMPDDPEPPPRYNDQAAPDGGSDETVPADTSVSTDTTAPPTETTQPPTEDTKPPVTEPDPNLEEMPTFTDDGTPAEGSMVEVPAPTTTLPAGSTHVADQAAVVTGTQVAVGDTGNNTTVNEVPGSTGVAPLGGAVDTGGADAIGSMDVNQVTQEAEIVLTDEAVANLLQIALILNFGAADSNSGQNQITSSPAGTSNPGAIGTGDAQAVGNQMAAYITQAANVDATTALTDDASQLAISMFLGLAIANSGGNSVLGNGVAGSGGAIDTGDTQAIGNDSLTRITQQAILLGADQSQLNVIQRATVLNLGFAIANSGLNDISGVAGALLAADDETDDYLAEQLFAMLLPALLQSYGIGVGSGTIDTGSAQAIGNQSETYVQQQVGAMAAGSGVANVTQDVLVANMGGAVANTGFNSLGTLQQLTPDQAGAVVKMAAFLANILAKVHHSSDAANMLVAGNETIEIPFGDMVLTLDGRLGGLDTVLTGGSARANVRQISIVISIGMARANTGRNVVSTYSETELLKAVSAVLPTMAAQIAEVETRAPDPEATALVEATPSLLEAREPDFIGTGNVAARNATVIQICQRINALSVACLAPPEPEEEPPADPEDPPVVVTPDPAVLTPVSPDKGEVPTTIVLDPDPHGFAPPALVPVMAREPADSSRHGILSVLPSTGSDIQVVLISASGMIAAGAIMTVGRGRRRKV